MSPPEAQFSPDVLPVEDTVPGGTAPEHTHPELEEEKPAAGGADKAGGVACPDAEEQVPPSRKAHSEPNAVPLDAQLVGPKAISETEALGNAESVGEWKPETEKAGNSQHDGVAQDRTPGVATEAAQPTMVEDADLAAAARASQVLEQEDAQSSPHEAVVPSFPTMSVTSDVRLRRSHRPMARATKAVKQRAAKLMKRGRSVGRRFAAWFSGSS